MAIHILDWDQSPPAECRDGALAIGNYDGVHRGHAALLAELRRQASAVSGPAIALTFDPHPLQLLRPEQFQPVLTTVRDRAELLQTTGADHVIILRTTPALLQLSAADFFERVVRHGIQARAMAEGPNFCFGHDRAGTLAMLESLCGQAGISLAVVPPFSMNDIIVSSSRVRNALLGGNVSEAAELMGRCYRMRGTVGVGQRRGRTLGFPTANLEAVPTLIPGDGVYAVQVHSFGSVWPGAANIGPNPTFGEQARKVEIHLIGFEGDLYGKELAIDFMEKLRDTRPFSGAAELVEQLEKDVVAARNIASIKGGR